MYFQALEASAEIRPELAELARGAGPQLAGLRADYARALRREHADMPLSARGDAEYLELRRARRADLEALVRSGMPEESLGKARDLICAIAEESAWAQTPEAPFEDDMRPTIDLMAAETACLFSWAKRAGRLDARTEGRMLFEARRRLFTPLIAHEDYPCLRGEGKNALATLSAALSAALLLETDGARLYALIRRAARAMDEMIDRAAHAPLGEALTDRATATAAWLLARKIAGPSALGRALPKAEWLDEFLMAYLGGAAFVDPMGEGVRAGLNGADLALLGEAGGDDAVRALGAQLFRANPEPSSALIARIFVDIEAGMAQGAVPRLRHAALPDFSIMSARGGGMFAVLHAGGRGNAGGVCAYLESTPVLVTFPGDAPVLNGVKQAELPGVGDCSFGDARADMSMDMTRLYPGSGVRFYQRTLMLDRAEGTSRLIDIVESEKQGAIRYTFITPYAPARLDAGVRMGVGMLSWEGAPTVLTRRVPGKAAFPDGLYLVELEYPVAPGSNYINFVIERA